MDEEVNMLIVLTIVMFSLYICISKHNVVLSLSIGRWVDRLIDDR